jgi:ABC-2 type transport system ATP-binding protein
MSIEVKKLTKIYGSQKALDEVSFSVSKGDILGFLGPNGAGKSTTMKILACFIPQTSGDASMGGLDVKLNSLEVRRIVGLFAGE